MAEIITTQPVAKTSLPTEQLEAPIDIAVGDTKEVDNANEELLEQEQKAVEKKKRDNEDFTSADCCLCVDDNDGCWLIECFLHCFRLCAITDCCKNFCNCDNCCSDSGCCDNCCSDSGCCDNFCSDSGCCDNCCSDIGCDGDCCSDGCADGCCALCTICIACDSS